jgi:serine/threonine protein kinase
VHRDIRPQNIFYSETKKSFVLGGLHNAVVINAKNKQASNVGYNLAGVPYYLPKYLVDIGKKEHYSEYYNYDPYKNDIYALGLTLMNALFLDTFMPMEVLTSSLRKYEKRYGYLNILKAMVSENPPSL